MVMAPLRKGTTPPMKRPTKKVRKHSLVGKKSNVHEDRASLNERGDQGKSSETRSADGEAFADGGGGVAHGVEAVSDLACFRPHGGSSQRCRLRCRQLGP